MHWIINSTLNKRLCLETVCRIACGPRNAHGISQTTLTGRRTHKTKKNLLAHKLSHQFVYIGQQKWAKKGSLHRSRINKVNIELIVLWFETLCHKAITIIIIIIFVWWCCGQRGCNASFKAAEQYSRDASYRLHIYKSNFARTGVSVPVR